MTLYEPGHDVPLTGPALTPVTMAAAMAGLVISAETAVVVSSLARSCVPVFSDVCSVELSEGVDATFRVTFPMADDAPVGASEGAGRRGRLRGLVVGNSVTTQFGCGASLGYPSFAGVMVHSWHDRPPTNADAVIARMLVDRAVALAHRERLNEVAARADERAAKLALDILESRVVGQAIGMLMADGTPEDAVLSQLRRAGRMTGRTFRDVCTDVVRSWRPVGLTPVPEDRADHGRGRALLHSVPGGR